MHPYPYNSPQILNDAAFLQYGGQTGSSTPEQRQAAYLISEEKMTEHLSAFLVPTIITGSAWYRGGTLFETEFGHVRNVLLVNSNSITGISPLEMTMSSGSALIRNAEYGYLDLILSANCYSNCGPRGMIYENLVVYESGLPTGTSSSPIMLAALTMAAQIHLNMWVQDLSNEGVGDIGIQSFSNMSYSENRVKLGRTVFGSSAIAQQIAQMTKKYRTKNGASLR